MAATNNTLVPYLNQRGYYEVIDTAGAKVPSELTNQLWTSERETNFSINAYLAAAEKKEKPSEK